MLKNIQLLWLRRTKVVIHFLEWKFVFNILIIVSLKHGRLLLLENADVVWVRWRLVTRVSSIDISSYTADVLEIFVVL